MHCTVLCLVRHTKQLLVLVVTLPACPFKKPCSCIVVHVSHYADDNAVNLVNSTVHYTCRLQILQVKDEKKQRVGK